MKLKVISCLMIVIISASARPNADSVITRYENENSGLGNYNYAYETSNGISAQEEGQLKNVGTEHEAIAVHGSYSFVAPDGQQYTVNYVADENGFRPEGIHLH